MIVDERSYIRLHVDLRNPGEFLGCCGLLELANRMWPRSVGWFEAETFVIANAGSTVELILAALQAPLIQLEPEDDMTSPLLLGGPFGVRLDWWNDVLSGGATFKTWAGQQKVVSIAGGMQDSARTTNWGEVKRGSELQLRKSCESLPFNFDANLGGLGSDRDVGFSFDPLKTIRVQVCPLLEFTAMVGLQRFRPRKRERGYDYATWLEPLSAEVASAVAACAVDTLATDIYHFRLLYRTKYLKSFLHAKPTRGKHDY